MQLTAKLTQLLPVQTGQGKNGPWKKQDIIVETEGKFPKKVCMAIWGDKVDVRHLQIGKQLNISFDVESREFNGKWYTDVKVFKIEAAGSSTMDNVPEYQDYIPPTAADEDAPF